MRDKIRRLGTFGDVAASGALVGVTAVVNFCSMLVFARGLGPSAFGLLSTSRRVVAFLAPFLTFGGHLGVSRYLGYYTSESRRRSAVFSLALGLSAITLPMAFGMFALLEGWVERISWISELGSDVWLATLALTAATATGLVVFSALRGFGHPQVANMHQLTVLSSFLVLGAALYSHGVTLLLVAFAISSAATNVGFLVWLVRDHRAELSVPSFTQLHRSARELTPYSMSRLADGPLQASLALIGVVLAPAVGGLALSGYIHISQTLVRMTEMLIVPLSVIFLPLVARQVRDGETERLQRQAQLIFDSVVLIGCALVVQGVFWAGPLLSAAFGSKYADATPYLMVTLPATLPFLLFAGFRSFIDGYSVRPVNSFNLLIASIVILSLSVTIGSLHNGIGLSVSYTLGMFLLGTLSVIYAARNFATRVFTKQSAHALALAALSGLIAQPASMLAVGEGAVKVFALAAASTLVVLGLLVAVATRLRHPLVVYSLERVRGVRSKRPRQPEADPIEASIARRIQDVRSQPAVERAVLEHTGESR